LGEAYVDNIQVKLESVGSFTMGWEDNNNGEVENNIAAVDFDGHEGYWIKLHWKWDTTRCDDGIADGQCGDAGEDEWCMRGLIDTDHDGSFDDESWTAWDCEASTKNFKVWGSEPSANELQYGRSFNGTVDQNIYIDDIETSYAKPSWD